MTRYYLDTEFIDDGKTIELISIGMVSDDGRELYFVSSEFDKSRCDEWLQTNVLNQLPKCTCPGGGTLDHLGHNDPTCKWRTRAEIRDAIREFVREEPKDQIEIWAYFASSDWVVFYQLFGKMIDMPKHFPFFVRCLKQYAIDIGYRGKFKELLPDTGHHDALADAKWNMRAHGLLDDYRRLVKASDAAALADKLLADLDDRAGFSVDGDAREMIRPDWIKLITEGLAQ
jgi:3'-5' exoribonuclease-like protein